MLPMLDRLARSLIDPWLEPPARRIAALGISANAVSLIGFGLGIGGCIAIGFQQYLLGMACILANRLADGLDGCVARQSRCTDVGGFLDFILDLLFYGGVPFAFAVAQPAALLPACFLIFSFMGTTGSFLAFAVMAAKRGMTTDGEHSKSFVYSAGLMEGTETVLFFGLFCVVPQHFAVLAWVFGSLCWLTVALRIVTGARAFQDRLPQPEAAEGAALVAPENSR